MSKVRHLSPDELITTEDIIKKEQNPTRILKLCSCKLACKRFHRTVRHSYAVVVEILGNKIALLISNNEDDARTFFYHCLDVIPCFWSPKVTSHSILSEIFDETVLTKLVKLIKEHGNTWSVAHMCVSLPLQEDTMMLLLASDSFKHYFKSNKHPKNYRLLHLAVEQNSLVACKAIMRCSDCKTDAGLYDEDTDGNTPPERMLLSQSWACLDYLCNAETEEAEATVKTHITMMLELKVSAEVCNCFIVIL